MFPLHVSKSCNKTLQHEHDVFAMFYFVFISDEMVYMYKEIAETCCLGVYGLIRPEIDY